MTDPRRTALRNPSVQECLTRACESYIDLLADPNASARYLIELSDSAVEACEEALLSLEVPAFAEWRMETDPESGEPERALPW